MGKIAFLFAGQGAQAAGMGQSLNTLGGNSAAIFKIADELRPETTKQCFNGTTEELTLTSNTQPCVFTVDLAAAYALTDNGITPSGVAGFSLGEMAALTFAEAFTKEEGFSLVCKRGELMQTANENTPGAMAAVLRLDDAKVEELCREFKQVYPVNYNSDGQLVVAGAKDEMESFCQLVKEHKGMAKMLAVGGGFHSPFMSGAAADFLNEINTSNIQKPTLPVYANYTAKPYNENLSDTLAKQMESPVLWKQTIKNMAEDGFTIFIEVGPGKTLTGLVKRILPSATLYNVQDEESLQTVLAALT